MQKKCKHCSTPFRVSASLQDYCCHGCEAVSRLIREEGLNHFYELQDQVGRPLKDRPFVERDAAWAVEMQRKAEVSEKAPSLILRVDGMTCMGCVWLIERIVRKAAGILRANVSLTNGSLAIQWDRGRFELRELAVQLQRYGYRLESGLLMGYAFSDLARRSLFCAVFAANVWILEWIGVGLGEGFAFARIFSLLALLFVGLGWFVAGGSFVPAVIRGLRARVFAQDILLMFGAVFAVLQCLLEAIQGIGVFNYSSMSSLATIIVLGRWIQMYCLGRIGGACDEEGLSRGSASIRMQIFYWAIMVAILVLICVPLFLISGWGVYSILGAVSAACLVTPVHLLYELSRHRDGQFAVVHGFIFSGLGLVLSFAGVFGPLGGASFSIIIGLLSVAVLGINRKLRVS